MKMTSYLIFCEDLFKMSSFFCISTADRKLKAAKAAFNTSIDRGITFFDTAEVYGSRVS